MDEETFFNCIDELSLRAKEDHTDFIKRLTRQDYDENDLLAEAHVCLGSKDLDWARLFVIALLGENLNVNA